MEIKHIDFNQFKHPPKIEFDQNFTNALNHEKGFEEPYQKKDFEKVNYQKYLKLPIRAFKKLLRLFD